MTDLLTPLFKIAVVIFMVGNLLDLGLRLDLKAALRGLRDVRFVGLSLLWAFVLCPAYAYGLAHVIPLTPDYAMGLILLGLAPCAPVLPMLADRARGDLNYVAPFMLLASAGTVFFMPLMVPVLVPGLSVSAWSIAGPMVFMVLLPLAVGAAIHNARAARAAAIQPLVKRITGVATLLLLVLVIVIHGEGFVGTIGSRAILAQSLFFSVVVAASYGLGLGMPQGQRSVLSLGVCTRNNAAALAPLLVTQGVAQQTIVMVALGVPVMFLFALIAARVFAARSGRDGEGQHREGQHGAGNAAWRGPHGHDNNRGDA